MRTFGILFGSLRNAPRQARLPVRFHRMLGASVLVLCALLNMPAMAVDNTSIVINGVVSNAAGNFELGADGTNNTLTIRNAGMLVNDVGYIGHSSTSFNNRAYVRDAGSIWTNSSSLYIGQSGAWNSLTVSNGGRVVSTRGYIGSANTTSNNTVLIAGSGSVWSNSVLCMVGDQGTYNTLVISNGAQAVGNSAVIGNGIVSANNRAIVTGAGSVWTNRSSLVVGQSGGLNSLVVSNGGQVAAFTTTVGSAFSAGFNQLIVNGGNSRLDGNDFMLGVTGSYNTVIVTNGGRLTGYVARVGYESDSKMNKIFVGGSGSVWSNSGSLFLGMYGDGNELRITDGGVMKLDDVYVGRYAGATNNLIVISGPGSTLKSSGVPAPLVQLGLEGSHNTAIVSNGAVLDVADLTISTLPVAVSNRLFVDHATFSASGELIVNNGSFTLNAGTATVWTLTMTNAAGSFNLDEGELRVSGSAKVSNGVAFVVGDGVHPATFCGVGNSSYRFYDGLIVNANSRLDARGTIHGSVGLWPNSHFSPFTNIAALTVSNLTFTTGVDFLFQKRSNGVDLVNVPGNLMFQGSPALTVRLQDLGGADFFGTNVLLAYTNCSGTPTWTIDYGNSGITNGRVTNNAATRQIELIVVEAPVIDSPVCRTNASSTAALGGRITALNGGVINKRGVFRSTIDGFTPPGQGIEVSESGSFGTGVFTVMTATLTPNTTYYFKAFAANAAGTGYTVQASFQTAPAAPAMQAPSDIGVSGFTANWQLGAGANNYFVDVATDSTFIHFVSGYQNRSMGNTAFCAVSGLAGGTIYYARVRAQGVGGISDNSGAVSATTLVPPNGTIAVSMTPPAGAWSFTGCPAGYAGPRSGVGNLAPTTAPTGAYTIAYGAMPGYCSPPGETLVVSANSVVTFTGCFLAFRPMANDFDGDRKADPAIYDEGTGTWTVELSGSAYYKLVLSGFLGGPGYVCAAADYDGDRIADPTVYQEATGNWIVMESSRGYTRLELAALLGGPGWAPASANYIGSDIMEFGAYQEATGNWKIKLGSNEGALEVDLYSFLGGPGCCAVSADFDGDGFADPTVYNRANGTWTLMLSSAGYASLTLPQPFGGADWTAVPGDFDGDGLADPAIRKSDASEWRIMLSGSGYAPISVPLGL